jgi:hypothetical protein
MRCRPCSRALWTGTAQAWELGLCARYRPYGEPDVVSCHVMSCHVPMPMPMPSWHHRAPRSLLVPPVVPPGLPCCPQDLAGPHGFNLDALTGLFRDGVAGHLLFGLTNFNTTCASTGSLSGAIRNLLLASTNRAQGSGAVQLRRVVPREGGGIGRVAVLCRTNQGAVTLTVSHPYPRTRKRGAVFYRACSGVRTLRSRHLKGLQDPLQ